MAMSHHREIDLVASPIDGRNHTTRPIFLVVEPRDGRVKIPDDRLAEIRRIVYRGQDDEIVSANVAHERRRPFPFAGMTPEDFRGELDRLVTTNETISVVECLEVVQIEIEDREWLAGHDLLSGSPR